MNCISRYCRDCKDLAIEVTYTGQRKSHLDKDDEIQEIRDRYEYKNRAKTDWFPHLGWMKSLKSLVLIKLGPYSTYSSGTRVLSHLLASLLEHLFPCMGNPAPRPLQRVWIQDFVMFPCSMVRFATPECLRSYRSEDAGTKENYESFVNIEHLAGKMGIDFSRPMSKLSKLKFATGSSDNYEEVF